MVVYHNPDDYWYYNKRYDDKEPERMKGCFYSLLGIVILTILSLLLSSCKSVQYVPVESHSVEHHYHNDTIKEKDSVITEKTTVIKEADSALVASLGLKLKSNERAILILQNEIQKLISEKQTSKSDTTIKIDSIQVPYPVERKLTKWEEAKMEAGGIAIVACTVAIFIFIIYWIIKLRRRK